VANLNAQLAFVKDLFTSLFSDLLTVLIWRMRTLPAPNPMDSRGIV